MIPLRLLTPIAASRRAAQTCNHRSRGRAIPHCAKSEIYLFFAKTHLQMRIDASGATRIACVPLAASAFICGRRCSLLLGLRPPVTPKSPRKTHPASIQRSEVHRTSPKPLVFSGVPFPPNDGNHHFVKYVSRSSARRRFPTPHEVYPQFSPSLSAAADGGRRALSTFSTPTETSFNQPR